MTRRFVPSFLSRSLLVLTAVGSFGAAALTPAEAAAQCNSPNPADWPAPAKPYFMLLVDTSGSMIGCTNPVRSNFPDSCPSNATDNSCGLEPTRLNDAKCALRQTVEAFSGQVNFGLSTFAVGLTGCSGGVCPDSCSGQNCNPPNSTLGPEGEFYAANGCTVTGFPDANPSSTCGNRPDCGGPNYPIFGDNWRNGGNIVVDMLRDPLPYGGTPPASNVSELLKWFDGRCDESKELFALGGTPIEGGLRSIHNYMAAGWDSNWQDGNYCPSSNPNHPTPLDSAQDPPCRSLNVILVTDGGESCSGNPANAARDLFDDGVTIQGQTVPVRTFVIGFAGVSGNAVDPIADRGDDGDLNSSTTALRADNEFELAQALATIISGAILPEDCNNVDDNCNGCIDEGYQHYCNERSDCCTGNRATCLANYEASIVAGTPDVTQIPCVTSGQSSDRTLGLCPNPGEECNSQDDNCNSEIDEGFGDPVCCPQPEVCDGVDDDCDGIIDNANGNPNPFSLPGCAQCVPSQEICDGCDNDCDGQVDEDIDPIPCGFSPPSNCAGQQLCPPGGAVANGACLPGSPSNRLGACNNNPQPEVCDGQDNDCDFVVDELPPQPCDVPGQPGLVYNDTNPLSVCERGTQPCNGTCTGFVGPSNEICDGLDNDCDGQVDEGNLPGTGLECGTNAGQCQKGTTACVGGTLVCTGGNQPQPETCNGVDDDCNGVTDDAPLLDAPSNTNCWDTDPSGCTPPAECMHQGLQWCPPPGATCRDIGTLDAPCNTGTLVCDGASGWKCTGGKVPEPEVCDGADNDCNGLDDDALGAPIGDACGSDEGECQQGTTACSMGSVVCQGETAPTAEVCDGLDNDCDGNIDNGIPLGDPCPATYDMDLYPGDREEGLCSPGVTECDTTSGTGATVCTGGIGPSPEVCDGLDNDCDGLVDEAGAAPDGIDGTAAPNDPSRSVGDPCGNDQGECEAGNLACVNGLVVCTGGKGPSTEICDCLDNDCDGDIDEVAGEGNVSLCGSGNTCAELAAGNCQCVGPCKAGEFPCPVGASCQDDVQVSGSDETQDRLCVPTDDACANCVAETVTENGVVVCGPPGTTVNGNPVPECTCKAGSCKGPCFNVSCEEGQRCVRFEPFAGTCQADNNCNFQGCAAGEICVDKACVENPCDPNPCTADEVCKPTSGFSEAECVGSCAEVTCSDTEKCVNGSCEPTGCDTACPSGEVCAAVDGGFACRPSQCAEERCDDGSYCDPLTGSCGNDPCEGIICPGGQLCIGGHCQVDTSSGGAGGSGGSGQGGSSAAGGEGGAAAGGSSGSAAGGSSASGGTNSSSDAGATTEENGVFGLATGGGGCSCELENRGSRAPFAVTSLVLVALAFARRRRSMRAQ